MGLRSEYIIDTCNKEKMLSYNKVKHGFLFEIGHIASLDKGKCISVCFKQQKQ